MPTIEKYAQRVLDHIKSCFNIYSTGSTFDTIYNFSQFNIIYCVIGFYISNLILTIDIYIKSVIFNVVKELSITTRWQLNR